MGRNPNSNEIVQDLMADSGLDRTTCEELVYIFCAQAQRLVLGISESLLKNDFQSTALFLHQLKGSAGNVRAKKISRLAIDAERAMKAADVNKVSGLLWGIKEILEAFMVTGKDDRDVQ
ncbi:MAG: Hpt domain-containing protein [Desulfosporosinus sp.]|nr:Hpt domain-containing protein [Desulfosporosinus sp.]